MVQILQKFVEVPQSQFLPVVDVAVLCSDTLSRDSKGATVATEHVRTVAAVMVGMMAAMRGSLLQFCSIFRPPSIWTLRPRVAGTPGV